MFTADISSDKQRGNLPTDMIRPGGWLAFCWAPKSGSKAWVTANNPITFTQIDAEFHPTAAASRVRKWIACIVDQAGQTIPSLLRFNSFGRVRDRQMIRDVK